MTKLGGGEWGTKEERLEAGHESESPFWYLRKSSNKYEKWIRFFGWCVGQAFGRNLTELFSTVRISTCMEHGFVVQGQNSFFRNKHLLFVMRLYRNDMRLELLICCDPTLFRERGVVIHFLELGQVKVFSFHPKLSLAILRHPNHR